MNEVLTGRVALVTGAASGIGRAIAEQLAGNGATVAVNDLSSSAAADMARDLANRGLSAFPVAFDVSDGAAVMEAVQLIEKQAGQIDVLVNNAGIDVVKPLLETGPDDWHMVLNVNLMGCVNCIMSVAPLMIRRQVGGRIINISSINALLGWRSKAAYSASKAAINALTRCAALELGPYSITVNAIAPGSIDTPIWGNTLTPGARRAHSARTAVGRLGVPDDVAALASFLASAPASYITGQVIAVDGGRSQVDFVPDAGN